MWLFTAKAESKSPHLLSLLSGVQSGVECVNNTERQIGRQIVTGFGLSASVVESGVPSISSGSNAAGCAFERCLVSLPFSRAGALRSSAARCTLVAPRSQRSRWTAGGGLPARAVDGRRICLVAACWSTCELHRVVGTAPLLLAMRLELQLRASVAFTQLVRDSTA